MLQMKLYRVCDGGKAMARTKRKEKPGYPWCTSSDGEGNINCKFVFLWFFNLVLPRYKAYAS